METLEDEVPCLALGPVFLLPDPSTALTEEEGHEELRNQWLDPYSEGVKYWEQCRRSSSDHRASKHMEVSQPCHLLRMDFSCEG